MSKEREQALIAAGLDPDSKDELLSGDELIDFYIELANIQKAAANAEKSASAAMKTISGDIIKHFAEHGQERVSRRGRTLYIARELWPKVLSDEIADELRQTLGEDYSDEEIGKMAAATAKERLIAALRESPDTEHLVSETYNSQTLRGFMSKDCDVDEDGFPIVPEHLEGLLGTSEVFRAKVLAR